MPAVPEGPAGVGREATVSGRVAQGKEQLLDGSVSCRVAQGPLTGEVLVCSPHDQSSLTFA